MKIINRFLERRVRKWNRVVVIALCHGDDMLKVERYTPTLKQRREKLLFIFLLFSSSLLSLILSSIFHRQLPRYYCYYESENNCYYGNHYSIYYCHHYYHLKEDHKMPKMLLVFWSKAIYKEILCKVHHCIKNA